MQFQMNNFKFPNVFETFIIPFLDLFLLFLICNHASNHVINNKVLQNECKEFVLYTMFIIPYGKRQNKKKNDENSRENSAHD